MQNVADHVKCYRFCSKSNAKLLESFKQWRKPSVLSAEFTVDEVWRMTRSKGPGTELPKQPSKDVSGLDQDGVSDYEEKL